MKNIYIKKASQNPESCNDRYFVFPKHKSGQAKLCKISLVCMLIRLFSKAL